MREWEKFLPPRKAPAFARASDVLVSRLTTLRAARRIDVPTWAEGDGSPRSGRRIAGVAWRNDFAPYMTEPSKMTTSRKYGAVIFVGPARTAKSESLVLNTIGHRIECAPGDMLVVCQTQDSAKQFSEKKLAPMLRANPHLKTLQATGRGADNIHEKLFRGNMSLQIRWPVIGYFSQNEYPVVILTDRDRMPDDVDGEGDPFALARKRTQQAGSRGMVIEEGSPGRLILVDDDWKPSTVHEVEPCGGILSDYMLGTRAAYYWTCPHCGDPFRPEFSRLKWDSKGSPAESAKTVEMICPNGCCIAPDRKFECNAAGIWLHETTDGQDVCELGDSRIRDTDIVSYRCEGPVAAMQSWEQLVQRYLEAKDKFDSHGDEQSLKSTINLDQGRAYRPAIRSVGDAVSEETLKALSDGHPMEIAPSWTRFITFQVDIQGTFFAVQADAWGAGLERRMIDRFDLNVPPATAPGAQRDENGSAKRTLDPARYFEDWTVLDALLDRVYQVEGGEIGMMPVAMIIDSAGRPGVTPNAYRFLRRMQRAGRGNRVYLAKGDPRMKDRARYATPDKVLQQKNRNVSDLKLVFVNTDELKDEVMLSLTRKEPGPGKYHLSEKLPARVFSELTAEVRTEDGWQKRRSGIANETFDLAVYGKALAIVLKAEAIDWANPPSWARPAQENSFAVIRDEKTATTQLVVQQPTRTRRVRSRGI